MRVSCSSANHATRLFSNLPSEVSPPRQCFLLYRLPESKSLSVAAFLDSSFATNAAYDREKAVQQLQSSKALDILHFYKECPKFAFSFFYQLKRSGYAIDVSVYAAVVRILCRAGHSRNLEYVLSDFIFSKSCDVGDTGISIQRLLEALHVFREEITLSKQRFSLLEQVHDSLVRCYAHSHMLDEAIDALFQPISYGFMPHIYTCNFLLNALCHKEKSDSVLAVYERLKQVGFKPNQYTYHVLLKSHCGRGCLEEVVKIFHQMEEDGITPNGLFYAGFIEALCLNGRTTMGHELLVSWNSANVFVDSYAYKSIIHGFCSEGKMCEAENVLVEMEKQGVMIDIQCYTLLIQGFVKRGIWAKALGLHDRMISKGIKTNCFVVGVVLQCLCSMGMHSHVIDNFYKFKQLGIHLDKVCYNIVLDALCKQGKLEDVLTLLDEIKTKLPIDVFHYTTLCNGYCIRGDVLGALKVFKEMGNKGFRLNVVTCNVLVCGLARKGLVLETLELLDFMEANGLVPDASTHNVAIVNLCAGGRVKEAETFFEHIPNKSLGDYIALINGYCKAKHTQKAHELFLALSGKGYLISKNCCYNLFKNLCAEGHGDAILRLFQRMLVMDVQPVKEMYDRAIMVFCEAADMKNARIIFDLMQGSGLTPNIFTYTRMIHGYCKASGLMEAYYLFHGMKRRGIVPDIVTLTVLLDAHAKACIDGGNSHGRSTNGVFDSSNLLREMKNLKIKPDVVYFTVLINANCRAGNLKGAMSLFDKMLQMGLEPDVVTYAILLSSCHSTRDARSANCLLKQMPSKDVAINASMCSAVSQKYSSGVM